MADIIQNAIDSSKVQVGPAATSGSGSLVDAFRLNDIGAASNLSPKDARALAQGQRPTKLNSFEKAQAFERASENAVRAAEAGKSRQAAVDASAEGSLEVRRNPMQGAHPSSVGSALQQLNLPDPSPDAEFAAMQAQRDKVMQYKQGVDLMDQAAAAWSEMTGTGSFLRMAIDKYNGERDFQPDPLFDSLEGREVWGARMPQEELEWVADSSSAEERQWKLDRLKESRENMKTIGAHGEGVGTIIGLSAGFLDPVGWAAGMGVGKVAQLSRIGMEMSAISRGVSAAAEGAAGNVLVTATMQAAGDYVTPGDYFYAAGFGAAFGTVMSAMQRGRPAPLAEDPATLNQRPEDAQGAFNQNAGEEHAEAGLRFSAGVLDEAQRRAGPDATPEQIAAASQEVYQERVNAFYRAGHEPLRDNNRLMPDADEADLYGTQPVQTSPDTGVLPILPLGDAPNLTFGERLDLLAQDSTGIPYSLKDGTSVIARIVEDRYGDHTIQLTAGGETVGSIGYGPAAANLNPDISVAEKYRRKGAGTLLYDLAQENGGGIGEKVSRQAVRTPDGQAIRSVYEFGQSKQFRRPSATTQEMSGGLTQRLGTVFTDVARRDAVGAEYGITPDTVPDSAQRLVMQEMLVRSIDQSPTFDQAKLQTLVGKWVAPIADSKMVANFSMPQHILARSEHPILRWWAANITESPTQNAGSRQTAAVEHAIREREYNSYIGRFNEAYTAWRNQNGGSAVRDAFSKQGHYDRFNKLVYEARENRALGLRGDEHPHVRAAADALDEAFARMNKDQKTAKTLGSEGLPDSSVGYLPRRINAAYLEANPTHRLAIVNMLDGQLRAAWGENPEARKLARKVAAEYVNRARIEAAGGVSVPGHLSDPHAASTLRDALAQHALSPADIDRYMARISRGGAAHTKGRLDLDLTQEVTLPDGTTFRLGDAFIQDNVGLLRDYARRTNGEVTLTRRGIQGKTGLDQLRSLLVLSNRNGDNKRWANELAAFDQTAAEIMGQPYGTASALADNLRILTGASRLGQAVLPQLAETAQLAASLGTEAAMRFAKDLPRLVKEVRSGKSNPILESLELPGGAMGDHHRYVMPWQNFDDVQLAGREANSAMSRVLRSAAQAQYTLTGHRYLVAAQVRGVSEQILHKVFRFVKSNENDAALRSMGITPELQAALAKDAKNIASFDESGALTALDIRQTDNPEAMYALKQAVERGANQIIQGNFIGERQAYLHDSLLKLLAQFRSYSLTAMSKQWTRTRVDRGTAKAVGILMGQMSFALPIHMARVMAVSALMSDDRAKEYRENNLTPEMLARATLNYATLSGSLGDVLDAGMGMLGYQASGVRTGSQSALGNVPALGYVDATARALKDKDVSGLIKAMPGGNSVFLLPAVNFTHWLQKED